MKQWRPWSYYDKELTNSSDFHRNRTISSPYPCFTTLFYIPCRAYLPLLWELTLRWNTLDIITVDSQARYSRWIWSENAWDAMGIRDDNFGWFVRLRGTIGWRAAWGRRWGIRGWSNPPSFLPAPSNSKFVRVRVRRYLVPGSSQKGERLRLGLAWPMLHLAWEGGNSPTLLNVDRLIIRAEDIIRWGFDYST